MGETVAKAKILVVENELPVTQFLSRVLTDEGHEVETINNASDALDRLKNERYSLVLLDIKLPGMSGIELYEHIQEIAKSLATRDRNCGCCVSGIELYKHIQEIAQSLRRRVVFITGEVMGKDTEDFLAKTKVPYITRPFNVEQLKKDVNRILTHGV